MSLSSSPEGMRRDYTPDALEDVIAALDERSAVYDAAELPGHLPRLDIGGPAWHLSPPDTDARPDAPGD
jgi:hypothetical protein